MYIALAGSKGIYEYDVAGLNNLESGIMQSLIVRAQYPSLVV